MDWPEEIIQRCDVQVTTKLDAGFTGGRVSQKYGADLSQAAPDAGRRSGDADLPAKPALADRRARLDNVRPCSETLKHSLNSCLLSNPGDDGYKYTSRSPMISTIC